MRRVICNHLLEQMFIREREITDQLAPRPSVHITHQTQQALEISTRRI